MLRKRKSFSRSQKRAHEDFKWRFFDPSSETVITADASSYGLGTVLKQKQPNGTYRPIVYAFRSLSTREREWTQIEKEDLVLVWAYERFANFIMRLRIILETDHKLLVPIFGSKILDELTPKMMRMRLRLSRYAYEIKYNIYLGKN